MYLKNIHNDFLRSIASVYDANEAENIWHLTVESITGCNLRGGDSFSPDACFKKMIQTIQKRLQKKEPIQYILNEAWFYDIPFYVNQNVLIPRPETEELVDRVIKDVKENTHSTILDIGTGSGCIAVILKRKIMSTDIIGCDNSRNALQVAQKNATKHDVDISLRETDILNSTHWALLPELDVIISNPPYIPKADESSMHDNVRLYEPHQALFVRDEEPLLFYEAIAGLGKQKLHPHGRIYVEIYEKAASAITKLFKNYGYKVSIAKDMQGKDRFAMAIL